MPIRKKGQKHAIWLQDAERGRKKHMEIELNQTESLTEFNSGEVLISPRQQLVMLALLSGAKQKDAAEAAGVDQGTVSRWMNTDGDFRREYTARRHALEREHAAKITKVLDKAFRTLDYLLSVSGDDYVRLEATKVAFKLAGLLPGGTKIVNFAGGQVNLGEQQVNVTKGE